MTCAKCGTDHEGYPSDSFGGEMRCLRAQAELMGAGWIVDQLDAAERDRIERNMVILRDLGLLP